MRLQIKREGTSFILWVSPRLILQDRRRKQQACLDSIRKNIQHHPAIRHSHCRTG